MTLIRRDVHKIGMSRMPTILRRLTVGSLATAILLLGCGQCAKKRDPAAGIVVERQADLSHLAVVAAARHYLLGIDTTTFRVEARIRLRDVAFDKAVKLADGGVLIVNDGESSAHNAYMFNPDCSLRTAASVIDGPNTPFVHGHLALVGSRLWGPGGVQVAIYQLNDLSHCKTLGIAGGLLRQEFFCGQDNRIFFPYGGAHGGSEDGKSFPVMLNAETLDTTHLCVGEPLTGQNAIPFVSAVHGDSLIILPIAGCRPIVYSIAARRVLAYRDLNDEIGVRTGNAEGIVSQPIVQNGVLTMLYASMGRTAYWVKIRLSDLTIVDVKRVLQDNAGWYAGDDFLTFGRFYVIEGNVEASKTFTATFIDWRTGEVAGQCTVNDLKFSY